MPIPLGVLAVAGAGGLQVGPFTLIETITASGSTSTVTFNNIPQTFKHLQIRVTGWVTPSIGNATVNIRFNGDTASNYNSHGTQGNGSGTTTARINTYNALSLTSIPQYSAMPGTLNNTSTPGGTIIDILDYTAAKNKTTRATYGQVYDTANWYYAINSGLWRSTSAITSITVFNDANYNFSNVSRFSLYGLQ